MSEPQDHDPTPDPDADPGQLNPRDTRGTSTGDGARTDPDADLDADLDADPDADPDALNPRSEDGGDSPSPQPHS